MIKTLLKNNAYNGKHVAFKDFKNVSIVGEGATFNNMGTWLINSIRTDDVVEKYEKLEQYILSFASIFDCGEFIKYDATSKRYFHTADFEADEELERYRDEYDDECFWDGLVDRLARRDFIKAYGEGSIKRMNWKERYQKEGPFIEKYSREVDEHGINRMEFREHSTHF